MKKIHAPHTAIVVGSRATTTTVIDQPENHLKKLIRQSTAKYERALLRLRRARAKVRACEKDVRLARRDMNAWLDAIGPESNGASAGVGKGKGKGGDHEPF